MDVKKLDLNQGDETPSGAGQPEQKTEEPTEEVEIDDVDIQPDSEEGEDVVLSKEKFQKLVEAKENYKKGLLTYKEKLKAKPKETDYLPKQDFYKANEKTAIDKFVKENPDVENNWSEFVKHYSGKRGKDSVESIIQDLDDAKTLFSKYNPPKSPEDNDAKANLAKETSLPSAQGADGKSPQKGGLIPKKSHPSEWYN